MTPLVGVVLAGGEGKRMRSAVPKPIQEVCGKPMILYLVESLVELGVAEVVVVVGRNAEAVAAVIGAAGPWQVPVRFARQENPRGTGDAAATALGVLNGLPDVVIVPSDAPLLEAATLRRLAGELASGSAAALLTSVMDDPTGYGRVLRSQAGKVLRLVEEGDATPAQRALSEVGCSTYCFAAAPLRAALDELAPDNVLGELYLTDVIGLLVAAGHQVATVVAPAAEVMGVNDPDQLAAVEAVLAAKGRPPA
jgi:bifunctional UDP-N-acetylglucosamine pyrophosphorylase / glucosamine-1-phosphate N-acetyltransferase